MSKWQPIETAPKDGTLVLVWDEDTPITASWDEGFGWCDNVRGTYWGFSPTHWMPLPEPPKDIDE